MKTKAAVLHDINKPLVIEEVNLDSPKADEVLVQVKASGLCHSDLNSMQDNTQPLPVILGHEAAGIVIQVGSEVQDLVAGDSVVLTWLPNCGSCYYCKNGQPQLCSTVIPPLFEGTLLDGTTRFSKNGENIYHYSLLSTFSEYTVVSARSCIKLPKEMPFAQASLIGCGVTTGWGAAAKAAPVKKDDTVVVIGTGGVGVSAIQGAKFAAAKNIIAVDNKAVNLELCSTFGATHCELATNSAALKELIFSLTDERGADVAIDATGSVKACQSAMNMIRNGGTVVVVGAFQQSMLELEASGFHSKGKTLKGSFYGDMDPRNGLLELSQLYLDGKVKLDELILERIALDDINLAFERFNDIDSKNIGRSIIEF